MAVAWRRRVVWQWSRAHLVHVRVEEAVAEADRGRFVRVAVGQLHVHAPASTVVRACSVAGCNYVRRQVARRAGQRAGRAHCLWARGRRRRCRSGYRPPGPPYSRTSSWREARGASIQGAKGAEGLGGAVKRAGRPFLGAGRMQALRGRCAQFHHVHLSPPAWGGHFAAVTRGSGQMARWDPHSSGKAGCLIRHGLLRSQYTTGTLRQR